MRRAKELGITLGNAAATHNGRMTPKHIEHGLLSLLLASMLASTAMAEALPSRSCESWNTARKANLSTAVQREWLFGYVNGWRDAQLAQTGQDIYQTMPSVEVLLDKTNAYCEAQPQSNVGQSVTKLLKNQP
jgi:hypothetical protein